MRISKIVNYLYYLMALVICIFAVVACNDLGNTDTLLMNILGVLWLIAGIISGKTDH